ncbi:hypothetical protein D1872_324500 [compost metagenome]
MGHGTVTPKQIAGFDATADPLQCHLGIGVVAYYFPKCGGTVHMAVLPDPVSRDVENLACKVFETQVQE